MAVSITRAESPEDLDAVRGLIREFHHWAMTEVSPGTNPPTFANLDAELAALPGIFGPPSGCLLLARLDGDPAGCLAFFGRDTTMMEVKRMYVRPSARGHRIGERLVTSILAEALRLGYRRYVLSTHRSMHHAHAIYRRAGFRDVPHSADFPTAEPDIAICMEMIPLHVAPLESRIDP
jgi:GNAT superfamily N-acetyltransferase